MNDDSLYVFPSIFAMGDNIVCNGLCRALARRESHVTWVSKKPNLDAVRLMFSDVPNVEVIDGIDWPEARNNLAPKIKRKLLLDCTDPNSQWDEKFYQDAGVEFKERWDSFRLPWQLLRESNGVDIDKFALLHEIPERGYRIDQSKLGTNLPKISITQKPNFWDWLPEIYSASELHFVDSSYLNLAESLYFLGLLRDTRLVFHSYAKKRIHISTPPILKAPWEILT